MTNIIKSTIASIIILCSISSCSLEEYNPIEINEDEKYATFEGFFGLTNYCYQPLYSELFTSSDYISTTEAGTDLWITANNGASTQQFFYYENLNTTTNAVKKLWLQAYSTINICNKVIARSSGVQDGSPSDVKILAAEAHCLRAFYYSILVEQYGNITLSLDDNSTGFDLSPKRNSVEEIYAQIISDLKYAANNLDVKPYGNNYGRVCKKTALGLLARAYIQGSGYNLTDQSGNSYLELAKETAEDFITNKATYGAYMYNTFAEVWLEKNNRNNEEALFSATGATYGTDAGKYSTTTSLYRYFFPNVKSFSDLGMIESGYYYGRTNAALYVPSKYLLNIFEDGDDRYDKSFVSAFSTYSLNRTGTSIGSTTLTQKICTDFGIASSWIGTRLGPQVDMLNSAWANDALFVYNYPYEPDANNTINGWKTVADDKLKNLYTALNSNPASNDLRVRMFFSRNTLTAAEKASRPYYCLNMNEIYDATGMHISSSTNGKDHSLWPGFVKFSHYEPDLWATYQNKTGDVMIMRMAEVYLIAAEANVRLGHPDKATGYINFLRKRAEKSGYDLTVTDTDMTMDFILDEYTREMCGEFNRWYILKRNHAFEDRLRLYNTRAYNSFNPNKHYVRPISQDFLNTIDNANEYGTNGY